MKTVIVVFAVCALLIVNVVFATTVSFEGVSLEELRMKAEQGDVNTQFWLGWMYASGEGNVDDQAIPQNYKEAVKWYTKAVEQGHAEAQFNLGMMYDTGQGVIQDYTKAAKWYRKAAEQGDTAAQYNLGSKYRWGSGVPQDFEEAIKWWAKSAELGFSESQFSLGSAYEDGTGVTLNYKEAIKWYRKAADQGHTWAQNNLGSMYRWGHGVPQDYKEAVKWYSKAAKAGFSGAQYNLGRMYLEGHGVIENFLEAYKWILVSGVEDEERKAWLRSNMSPGQIAEAQKQAKEYVGQKEKEKEKANGKSPSDKGDGSISGFGSGFFITKDGHFLTAAHVVDDVESIRIYWKSKDYTAKKVFVDNTLDVAVLKVAGVQSPQPLFLSGSSKVKTGDAVFTLGFPQVQLQGLEAKYTDGSISSLSGIANDPKYFQISVPVQPGNSGGPLLDGSGNVVGLITARLDAIKTLEITGSLPQNVNYALKSSFILPLLGSVPDIQLEKPSNVDKSEAIKRAKIAVGLVVCFEDS